MLSYAQFLPANEIFQRTARQSTLCPPEKVYLHTDRNQYVAGENIWMRAHVVDGVAHVPMKLSRYVYVVLQNPFMETVKRVRLYRDKDGYIYGNIPLPEDLPKGEYTLLAYTKYMKNFDEAYCWKKKVWIDNPLSATIQMRSSLKGNTLSIQFIDPKTSMGVFPKTCVVKTSGMEREMFKHDSIFTIKLHQPDTRTLLIRSGNYAEYVSLAGNHLDYDVSFLPEGGGLVSENFNRLAFKAINELGQGEDITGYICDECDSIIIHFNSLHRGMGQIVFRPERGKTYWAVCENMEGRLKRFELPKAEDKYTMQVSQFNGRVYVKVLFDPIVEKNEKLIVFAHQRGWPVKIGKWSQTTPGLVCKLSDFINGTASFLLLTENGQIVSERMIFINHGESVHATLKSNDSIYSSRQKINLSLIVKEKRWKGDCSVAITNNADVAPDSCINLLSSLLLTSDLQGYIEEPTWYFKEMENVEDQTRQNALDILMMTQGWKKYDISKAWAENYHEPSPIPELWQEINGKVTSRITRKPVEKAKVQLIAPSAKIFKKTKTDKNGRFSFVDFDAPDSTIYWISALTSKDKSNIVLELDTVESDKISVDAMPPFRNKYKVPTIGVSRLVNKVKDQLMYENGIRHLFLDEVIVTASSRIPKTIYEKINGAKSIKENRIKNSGVTDLLTFLRQQYPAISWTENEGNVVLLLRGKPVTIILDGFIGRAYDLGSHEVLRNFQMKDVEQIDIITAPYSLSYDPLSEGGIIAISTKTGENGNAKWHPTNLKTVMPLGYQRPVEFYVPKYKHMGNKVNPLPDLRTTIHWQPRLKVNRGKADIEFYAADGLVDYTVVIEGVGEDGSLLRIEKTIR